MSKATARLELLKWELRANILEHEHPGAINPEIVETLGRLIREARLGKRGTGLLMMHAVPSNTPPQDLAIFRAKGAERCRAQLAAVERNETAIRKYFQDEKHVQFKPEDEAILATLMGQVVITRNLGYAMVVNHIDNPATYYTE